MKFLKYSIAVLVMIVYVSCVNKETDNSKQDKISTDQLVKDSEALIQENSKDNLKDEVNEAESSLISETKPNKEPYIHYLESKMVSPRLEYYRKDIENTTSRDWPSELWAILDGDKEIQIPYPKEHANDIRMYALGDINGNGFEEVLISVGGMGSCCYPSYTIASFDGESFKLSKTLEWVKDYKITEEDGKTYFEFLLPNPNLHKEKYVYENYNLNLLKNNKAKVYKVIRELTMTDLIVHQRSESKEYLVMDYVKNDSEYLQIAVLPNTYKDVRFALYNPIEKEIILYYNVPDSATSIGISKEEINGYPVLIINKVFKLTKNGRLLNREVGVLD